MVVMLTRAIYISRENRRSGVTISWRESAAITGIAMLLAGVVIWENRFSAQTSLVVSMGIGWTIIPLFDVFGDRVLTMFGARPDATKPPAKLDDMRTLERLPPSMHELIGMVDAADDQMRARAARAITPPKENPDGDASTEDRDPNFPG